MSDADKVVIVTGANAGIGLAAARQLAARGAEVVMACRSPERGERARAEVVETTASARVHLMVLDTSSMASVERFAAEVRGRFGAVHALINNAGNFDLAQREPVLTSEGNEAIWATNLLGPWWLTEQLLPVLRAAGPGRVIDVSSKGLLAHPFLKVELDNVDGGRRYSPERAYYHSKLALLTHTLDLARRHDPSELVAHAVWVPAVQVALDRLPPLPAWQRSIYLLKRRFSITPDEMAVTYTALALDPEWATTTGQLVDHHQRTVKPPRAARDEVAAAALERACRAAVEGAHAQADVPQPG